jgi:hypothetical protein
MQGAWVKAGELSSRNKWIDRGIGLIDAVLIFSARESKAKIWTLDKKLKTVLHKNENFGQFWLSAMGTRVVQKSGND